MKTHKTRAAVLRELGRPLSIEELRLPPLSRGQILVQMAFAGICHTQLSQVRGRRGEDKFLPHLLGHEGSGTVIDIGEGVERVVPGDLVVLSWIKSVGLDAPGPILQAMDGSRVNAGPVTVFSDYTIVSENCVTKLKPDLPLDVAALMGCAVPTGAGMVLNQLRPQPGQSAAVFGVGGIGLSAVMALSKVGCHPIVAIDIDERKLALARKVGASEGVLWGKRNFENAFDYAIEASGKREVIEAAFLAIKKGGELMIAGNPPFGQKVSFDPYGFIFGKKVSGSAGGSAKMVEDIRTFADWYQEGSFPVDQLIAQKFSLTQINAAMDALDSGVVGRLLVQF